MEQKKWKGLLSSLLATGGIFAFSAVMFLLHWQSKYRLFLLSAIFLLMLAAINLILIACGRDSSESNDKKTDSEESGDTSEETKKKKGFGAKALKILKLCATKTGDLLYRSYLYIAALLLVVVLVICFVWFGMTLWTPITAPVLPYWQLAVVAIMFVVAIVADNLCKHSEEKDTRFAMLLRNACIFFKLSKIILVVLALAMTLSLLNIYDIQLYVTYVLAALFYYVGIMITVSLAVRLFRKELESQPGVVVLLPFMGADARELSVVSFLEENTGITLRSLWSIKYVKKILPYTLLCAALLFWVSTGVVYVQSHQEAAVYRLGSLQEETLKPGLHINLPYPLDKAEIYDTQTVNKMTIGYKSSENIDNVWTENHGESEYRLLLGSGKELVSINLRLEYRISDLRRYLSFSSSPERVLEAKAYELVTDRTISTDLESILATNRESFSESFFVQLKNELKSLNTGVEVVSVVLESIHPPVEVADIYQSFIGAEIDAERCIYEAQGEAAQIRAAAQTAKHEIVNYAKVNYYESLSAATTEISEFMAAVTASNEYPDEYKYYKYLEAICGAYQNARLVIVGDGVDSSRLHFIGNIYVKE